MKRKNKKLTENLSKRLQEPLRGLGAMHYSSLSPDEVRGVFKRLSSDFRHKYKLDIPRIANDAVDTGHGLKYTAAGCYWVVERK